MIMAPILWMVVTVGGVVIFPIWMLIHCANSQRASGAKTGWIIAIVLTWPLGAIIYGLFAAGRNSAPFFAAVILIILALASIPPTLAMVKCAQRQAGAEFAKLDELDTQELVGVELMMFQDALQTIQAEAGSTNLYHTVKALHLTQLYTIFAKDGKISSQEYREWMEKFNARETLDKDELEAYVKRFE